MPSAAVRGRQGCRENIHRCVPLRRDISDSWSHGGLGVEGDGAEVGRMQAGVRTWVVRAANTTRDLRGIAPTVLLSLLCASAFSPLLPVVAGLGAAAVVGSSVLSSIGGGVLSTVITEVLDRARSKGKPHASASAELERRSLRRSAGYWRRGMRTRRLCGPRSLRCCRRSMRAGPCCGRRWSRAMNGSAVT